MIKITYFSPNCFYSTDKMILHDLNKKVDLSWYLYWDLEDKKYTTDEVKQYAQKNGIKLNIIYKKYRIRDIRSFSSAIRIVNKLKSLNSDCYYFESPFNLVFWFSVFLLLPRKKIIWAWHDVVPHIGRENLLTDFVQRTIIKRFKNHQVFSNTQKQLFRNNFNYANKKVFSIPLALHTFGECEKNIARDKTINFLFFGSIRKNKGLDVLLKAANQLQKEFQAKIRIIIVGNCVDFSEYEKLILNHDIFELIIETVPNEVIPCLFNRSDYLILPYRDVTQSGPLMIALNYDIPVICSDHFGFKEYIKHGENGYIFENENVLSLSEKLILAINNHDTDYNNLVEGVRLTKKNQFSLDKITDKYTSMFTHINNNQDI